VSGWSAADVPDQAGHTVLVTGANSGLGLQTATVLAGRGATVLMACRDPQRGRAALNRVRSGTGGADATLVQLDLADLDDLNFQRRRYNPGAAYSASKLANLLFTLELDRRARGAGRDLSAVAAHPGLTDTELVANTTRMHLPAQPVSGRPAEPLAGWQRALSPGTSTPPGCSGNAPRSSPA
jgi:NAD(P)-dependent dehydrogenase (short-subunit alcohol dehydrogenase family)